jgi:hypothetical protein
VDIEGCWAEEPVSVASVVERVLCPENVHDNDVFLSLFSFFLSVSSFPQD